MSIRPTPDNAQYNPNPNPDVLTSVDGTGTKSNPDTLTMSDLTEVERSAATIGENPDAFRPISWINAAHYTSLLNSNALSSKLVQQVEAYKLVSTR